jgi:hypothetical protein
MGIRIGFTSHRPTFHAGTDIGAPNGTPIYAPRAGVVERLAHEEAGIRGNPFNGYGNAIVLYHEDEHLWSFYAHLSRIGVAVGDRVEPGQYIGNVGNKCNGKFPGMSPHLHLELRHAKADGSSPYPGPYPRLHGTTVYNPLNLEPLAWLGQHGIQLGSDGWTWDRSMDTCPSPQLQQQASLGPQGALIHTQQFELQSYNPGTEDDSSAYEPPISRDPDLIPFPWQIVGLGLLGVVGVGGITIALRK